MNTYVDVDLWPRTSIRGEWFDSRSRRFYPQGEIAGTVRMRPSAGLDAIDKGNIFAAAGCRARFLGCPVRRIASVLPELRRLTHGVTEMLALQMSVAVSISLLLRIVFNTCVLIHDTA